MAIDPQSHDLAATYLRLRGDMSIEPLPVGADFWQCMAGGQLGSFHNEYLVTTHHCDADWPFWEMHPQGDEVVAVLSGALTLVVETAAGERRIPLAGAGSFVIVPRGAWHTARNVQACRLLFITAGENTQHRPLGDDAAVS
jgi:mannose-6-phosphate isomerase-like protein (cupin superfamily)